MEWITVWAGLLVGVNKLIQSVGNRPVTLGFRRYQRKFVRPLRTAHGPWSDRQGLIVRLQTPATRADAFLPHTSYGEIAPIPWFGTETLDEAIAALKPLQDQPASLADLSAIMEGLPPNYSATRFGLGLAIAQLQGHFPPVPDPLQPEQICVLLPSGTEALEAWPKLWKRGHRTFKWKLGIADLVQELASLEQLRRSLPTQAKLRLDANGSLDLKAAQACLQCCDALAEQNLPIEFLEQPLPPHQFEPLLQLSQTYRTPLALDESVTGLPQLKQCYRQGWQGIFVIKGAIAGDPLAVLDFCQRQRLKVVFSSVFETSLARQAVLTMAAAVHHHVQSNPQLIAKLAGQASQQPDQQPSHPPILNHYAQGFGVDHWLVKDGLSETLHGSLAHSLRSSGSSRNSSANSSSDDWTNSEGRGGLRAKSLEIQGNALWNQLSNG